MYSFYSLVCVSDSPLDDSEMLKSRKDAESDSDYPVIAQFHILASYLASFTIRNLARATEQCG